MLAWVYGSGFPKSFDVSKAIDKAAGAEREVIGMKRYGDGNTYQGSEAGARAGGIIGKVVARAPAFETAPATDAARQWQGWGTALKPAWEPIILARKPLDGTVAENVLKHGTGGLNIDGCRIGTSKNVPASVSKKAHANCYLGGWKESGETPGVGGHDPNIGRWPANLIHDGSDEVVVGFPSVKTGVCPAHASGTNTVYGDFSKRKHHRPAMNGGDSGSAARFFYCAKASKRDRDEGLDGFDLKEVPKMDGGDFVNPMMGSDSKRTLRANIHPTVKPTDLMRHLCRLVTPPGGIVLDPFMGSGSTGKAAMLEGFRFMGCELDPDYMTIAEARIRAACADKH